MTENKGIKKRERLLYLLVIVVLLVVVLVLLVPRFPTGATPQSGAPQTDALRFKQEYEEMNGVTREDGAFLAPVDIPEGNPFVYTTVEEVWEFSKTGTGVVFFGANWCRLCRLAAPAITEAAGRYDTYGEVRYVTIQTDGSGADTEAYQALATQMCDYMKRAGTSFANVTGSEDVIASFTAGMEEEGDDLYPSVVLFYNKGTLVGMNVGTVAGHNDSDIPLSPADTEAFMAAYDEHMATLGTNPCPTKC